MLLDNEWVNNEIKEEIKKKQYLEINTNEHNRPEPRGHREGNLEMEFHSNIGLPKED